MALRRLGSPRFKSTAKGYGNEDEHDIMAMVVTIYHWGLHGWIPYTTMGAVIAIMPYRRGFPLTIRYCLYPLLGDKCYGWKGDAIDALSIITTAMRTRHHGDSRNHLPSGLAWLDFIRQ